MKPVECWAPLGDELSHHKGRASFLALVLFAPLPEEPAYPQFPTLINNPAHCPRADSAKTREIGEACGSAITPVRISSIFNRRLAAGVPWWLWCYPGEPSHNEPGEPPRELPISGPWLSLSLPVGQAGGYRPSGRGLWVWRTERVCTGTGTGKVMTW